MTAYLHNLATATTGLATGLAWLWEGLAVLIAACAVVWPLSVFGTSPEQETL